MNPAVDSLAETRLQSVLIAKVRWAGVVSLMAWAGLAWRSHGDDGQLWWLWATLAIAWGALGWAWRGAGGASARDVIFFALGFRLVAFCAVPVLEDDHFRFLWDGYRFAVTGDPYAEAPLARFGDPAIPEKFRAVLDEINYPDVPTVYGPFNQWAFRASHAIAPAELWPWKLILLGAELAILAMLWPVLSGRGRLLLAWCPLAIFETGFNAHPDALALALVVAAWWLGQRGWRGMAGVAVGLAVGAKVFAVLIAPFLLWRLGRRAWVASALAVVGLYAPFWLSGSSADLAGLSAMAGEWEFNSSVFAVVQALASRGVAQAVCGLAFGVIGLLLLVRWARAANEATSKALPPGEWIYGTFLLLSATANPWYALWLWPFVAMRPTAVGVAALAAVSFAYGTGLNLGDATLGNFDHPAWLRPLEFGLIAGAGFWSWQEREKARSPLATGPSC